MKLSQMTTDKATDVLCEIAPYAMNIMTDEDLMNELKSAVDFNNAETMAEKMAANLDMSAFEKAGELKKRLWFTQISLGWLSRIYFILPSRNFLQYHILVMAEQTKPNVIVFLLTEENG